jgi:hypothetical protein
MSVIYESCPDLSLLYLSLTMSIIYDKCPDMSFIYSSLTMSVILVFRYVAYIFESYYVDYI